MPNITEEIAPSVLESRRVLAKSFSLLFLIMEKLSLCIHFIIKLIITKAFDKKYQSGKMEGGFSTLLKVTTTCRSVTFFGIRRTLGIAVITVEESSHEQKRKNRNWIWWFGDVVGFSRLLAS
jgi:hypothetical protein